MYFKYKSVGLVYKNSKCIKFISHGIHYIFICNFVHVVIFKKYNVVFYSYLSPFLPLPQYAFMAWCLVKHRDNFTFYLYL
jgi:hypothetical protein